MRVLRTFALSGAAAVALLGTAGTASAETPEHAGQAAVAAAEQAAGTPVTLPSGRTLSVRGLESASYRADATHRTAVVTLADAAPSPTPGVGLGGGNDVTTQQQPGVPQQPGTYNPQQVTTQSSAGVIGVTAVAALILGIVVWMGVKKSGLRPGWAVTCIALGVLLSGTFIGPLIGQLTGSGVTAFGNLWAGL